MAIPLILTSTLVELQGKVSVNMGLGMMLSCFSWPHTLGRDTIFLWTIFTPPSPFFKHLYNQGVVATGKILPSRHSFLPALKKSQEWAKGWERQSMHWVRGPPCLVLQWVDNKVVSMITTVGNENEQGQVTCRVRTYGEWGERLSLKFLRPTT